MPPRTAPSAASPVSRRNPGLPSSTASLAEALRLRHGCRPGRVGDARRDAGCRARSRRGRGAPGRTSDAGRPGTCRTAGSPSGPLPVTTPTRSPSPGRPARWTRRPAPPSSRSSSGRGRAPTPTSRAMTSTDVSGIHPSAMTPGRQPPRCAPAWPVRRDSDRPRPSVALRRSIVVSVSGMSTVSPSWTPGRSSSRPANDEPFGRLVGWPANLILATRPRS